MRRFFIVLMIIAIGLLAVTPLAAEDEPVVFVLFFYSPTCSHCHAVIGWFEESGILEEFGSQMVLFPFDVTTQDGAIVYQLARQAMDIESSGVPMMLIGETILYGSAQIPAEMHDIVSEGLENGGIGLPPIPGLQEAYDQMVAQQDAADTETETVTESDDMTKSDDQLSSDARSAREKIMKLFRNAKIISQ